MAKSEKNLVAVFTDTANAIRGKLESQEQISPLDFADQINSIPTGIEPSGTLEVTENGVKDVTTYASVDVNVPGYPEPEGTDYIETNGEFNIKDYEYVNVNVPNPLEGAGEGLFYWYESSGSLYPVDLSESRYWSYNGGSNFTALDLEDVALYYGGGSTGEGFTKIELEEGKTYLYSGKGNFQEVE